MDGWIIAGLHGAEFEEGEVFAMPSDPGLPEKGRSARGAFDGDSYEQKEGREQKQQQRRPRNVGNSFQHLLQTFFPGLQRAQDVRDVISGLSASRGELSRQYICRQGNILNPGLL